MPKVKKAKSFSFANDHWEIHDELQLEGKMRLIPGREFRVRGERGRFVFIRYVYNPEVGEGWIDAQSANPKNRASRSFKIERVTRVHRKVTVHPRVQL
jgi:hypothetical protein